VSYLYFKQTSKLHRSLNDDDVGSADQFIQLLVYRRLMLQGMESHLNTFSF